VEHRKANVHLGKLINVFSELLLNVTYTRVSISQYASLLMWVHSEEHGQHTTTPDSLLIRLVSIASSTPTRLKNSLIRLALAVKLAIVSFLRDSGRFRESEKKLQIMKKRTIGRVGMIES
jgi:hypothetical protein